MRDKEGIKRMENNRFITIKDHKENLTTNQSC